MHHVETMGNHYLLVFYRGIKSFQGFLGGAGFGPSTVLSLDLGKPIHSSCCSFERKPASAQLVNPIELKMPAVLASHQAVEKKKPVPSTDSGLGSMSGWWKYGSGSK